MAILLFWPKQAQNTTADEIDAIERVQSYFTRRLLPIIHS